jgi:hypothetical protein
MTISIRVEASKLDNPARVARVDNSRVSRHQEEIQTKSKVVKKVARERDVALKMIS